MIYMNANEAIYKVKARKAPGGKSTPRDLCYFI